MDVKKPPASTCRPRTTIVSTCLSAFLANFLRIAPVEVLTLTMLRARFPCTRLNEPPRNALVQSPCLKAMEFTWPLTPGRQLDTVYGAVALKLNALRRLRTVPPWLILVNLPTAYIRLPH